MTELFDPVTTRYIEAMRRMDSAYQRATGLCPRCGRPLDEACLSCEREDGARFDRDQFEREVGDYA